MHAARGASEKSFDVICAGEALWQFVSTDGVLAKSPRARHLQLGGGPVNVALALAREGFRVGLATVLSDDSIGRSSLEKVATAGIDVEGVALAPRLSNLVLVDARDTTHESPLGIATDRALEIPASWSSKLLFLSGLSPAVAQAAALCKAARRARRDGTLVLLHCHATLHAWTGHDSRTIRALFREVDAAHCSLSDLATLGMDAAMVRDALREDATTIVSDRSGGAVAMGQFGEVTLFPSNVMSKSTDGAADAFSAAMCTELLRGTLPGESPSARWDRALRRGRTWAAKGLALLGVTLALAACGRRATPSPTESPSVNPSSSAAAPAALAQSSKPPPKNALAHPARVREGSAIVRSVSGDALWVADEDHATLHRLALPLTAEAKPTSFATPGPPSQLVALDGRLLVTIREPGLVVSYRTSGTTLVEEWRVPVAADAWGIAVDEEETFAFVTSAWTHRVSAIDLTTHTLPWTLDVAREPRGIVAHDASSIYVSHLTNGDLTKIDARGGTPHARTIAFPAAPLRLPVGAKSEASLGYALTTSPDGKRLFAARHSLSATFSQRGTRVYPDEIGIPFTYPEFAWAGAGALDVLLTSNETPLAPPRSASPKGVTHRGHCDGVKAKLVAGEPSLRDVTLYRGPFSLVGECKWGKDFDVLERFPPFAEPRAMAYRTKKDTLLVADEGTDRLVELDARALDPAASALATYEVGAGYLPEDKSHKVPALDVATAGGAPSGVVLSDDEDTAYVWCRATYDVAAVSLDRLDEKPRARPPTLRVRLAEDLLTGDAALGRRVFFNAREPMVSGEPQLFGEGMSCNGCHPDGRDDGHVWHSFNFGKLAIGYRAAISGDVDLSPIPKPKITGDAVIDAALAYKLPMPVAGTVAIGAPRQTPTLAGRITKMGPYGWHAQNPTLVDRILEGFSIHRGIGPLTDGKRAVPWWFHDPAGVAPRVDPKRLAIALEAFVRSSAFTPPPHDGMPLTAEETRGKGLFEQPERGCVGCHAGDFDTDLALHVLPAPSILAGFVADSDERYRTPSLRFVGGTAPYFHDGRAPTLEALLADDHDSMGTTSDLSEADRRALVAYLRRL